jgi:hypothetical protein
MVIVQCTYFFVTVVLVRFIELVLELFYRSYLKPKTSTKSGESYSSTSYKRLSTDVTPEVHKEVVDMATRKGTTIKEYVLVAIMTRLKADTKKLEKSIEPSIQSQ